MIVFGKIEVVFYFFVTIEKRHDFILPYPVRTSLPRVICDLSRRNHLEICWTVHLECHSLDLGSGWTWLWWIRNLGYIITDRELPGIRTLWWFSWINIICNHYLSWQTEYNSACIDHWRAIWRRMGHLASESLLNEHVSVKFCGVSMCTSIAVMFI